MILHHEAAKDAKGHEGRLHHGATEARTTHGEILSLIVARVACAEPIGNVDIYSYDGPQTRHNWSRTYPHGQGAYSMDNSSLHLTVAWTNVAIVVLCMVLALVLIASVVRRTSRGYRALASVLCGAALAEVVLFVRILSPHRDFILLGAFAVCLLVTLASAYGLVRQSYGLGSASQKS